MRRGVKNSFQPPLRKSGYTARKDTVQEGIGQHVDEQNCRNADAESPKDNAHLLTGGVVKKARRGFKVPIVSGIKGSKEKCRLHEMLRSGDTGAGCSQFYTVLYTKREPKKVWACQRKFLVVVFQMVPDAQFALLSDAQEQAVQGWSSASYSRAELHFIQ